MLETAEFGVLAVGILVLGFVSDFVFGILDLLSSFLRGP
jgi:hypothetical protein